MYSQHLLDALTFCFYIILHSADTLPLPVDAEMDGNARLVEQICNSDAVTGQRWSEPVLYASIEI